MVVRCEGLGEMVGGQSVWVPRRRTPFLFFYVYSSRDIGTWLSKALFMNISDPINFIGTGSFSDLGLSGRIALGKLVRKPSRFSKMRFRTSGWHYGNFRPQIQFSI